MYVPSHFRESDEAVIGQLMEANGFATIVSTTGGRPIASHLPIEVREGPDTEGRLVLAGHMAHRNPLWKTFGSDTEVLVVFLGAHTYISSTWYSAPAVPTWNYSAVHAYGRPRIIDDRDELRMLLGRLINRHERGNRSADPFKLDDLPAREVDQMMTEIVGFEITVTEIQAVSKLSQNRSDEDFTNVVEALRNRLDEASHLVADAMVRLDRSAPDAEKGEA